jgi:hypothetical protein
MNLYHRVRLCVKGDSLGLEGYCDEPLSPSAVGTGGGGRPPTLCVRLGIRVHVSTCACGQVCVWVCVWVWVRLDVWVWVYIYGSERWTWGTFTVSLY